MCDSFNLLSLLVSSAFFLLPCFKRGVAQPGRALGLGPRSRRFESCRPDNPGSCFHEIEGRTLFIVDCGGDSRIAFFLLGGPMKTMLVLSILAAMPLACAPCDLDSTARTEQEKKAVFCIVLGEGGGIRGTWNGHTVTGDGLVYVWNGRGARENEREVGRMPPDTMCALWDAARSLSTTFPVDSTGSLVRFLSVTIRDSTRKYSWIPKLGTGLPGHSYQEFYDRCGSAIRRSVTQTTTTTPITK